MRADEFVELMHSADQRSGTEAEVAYGTIPSTYVSGRPTVKFDGETAASGRTYPYLSIYAPAANDRVELIRRRGGTWVVQGKVI